MESAHPNAHFVRSALDKRQGAKTQRRNGVLMSEACFSVEACFAAQGSQSIQPRPLCQCKPRAETQRRRGQGAEDSIRRLCRTLPHINIFATPVSLRLRVSARGLYVSATRAQRPLSPNTDQINKISTAEQCKGATKSSSSQACSNWIRTHAFLRLCV